MKIYKEVDITYLIGTIVFLVSFGVYLHTLAPSITYEDSGELITSPYILGITHPSGYPLYTVIMKVLITIFPVSNIAFRGNLSTAVFGSLSVLMVYFIVLKVERNLIKDGKTSSEFSLNGYVPAVIAALVTSFSGMIWLHSVTTEVYTLNLFLMMLLTLILMIWENKRDIRYVFLGSLIYGLSFGNHLQAVMFFPAFLYFFLITDWREILKIKYIVYILSLFCMGLIIYIYLPLRSVQDPYLDWSNPESWRGFLFAIKREQYGAMETLHEANRWFRQLSQFGFVEQVSIWTFFFSFFGLYRLLRKDLKIFTTFSLITFCSGIGFVYIVNPPTPKYIITLLRTFYLPMYAMLAIWISFGAVFILEKIYLFLQKIKAFFSIAWAFTLLLFLLLPLTLILDHYESYDLKENYFAYDYAVNMARTCEEKSVIYTFYSADTFPLWFYKYSEGRRMDLAVVHQKMIILPWYYAQIMQEKPKLVLNRKEFADWNFLGYYDIRPQIVTNDLMKDNPEYKFYYTLFAVDISTRYTPTKNFGILRKDTEEDLDAYNEKIWLNYSYRSLKNNKSVNQVRDKEILRQLFTFNLNMARKYLNEKKSDLAIYQYQLTNKIIPNPEAYYNLGLLYSGKNMNNSAIRDFKEFIKLEPDSDQSRSVRKWLETFNPKKI